MTDIVLITIESLRGDYFDKRYFPKCWGTFNTDFCEFTDAYSNGVATPLSFPSIHTGYPVTGGGSLQEESQTIAESVKEYSWAISNNPHLRGERGYDRGFDEFTDQLGGGSDRNIRLIKKFKDIGSKSKIIKSIYHKLQRKNVSSPAPEVTAANIFSSLKGEIKNNTGLFWVHLGDSHYPFTPWKVPDEEIDVPYGTKEIREMNDRFLNASPKEGDIEFLTEMYGKLIQYIDRQLINFLNYLDGIDKYKESMIIIMSDHGEGFGEEGMFKYTDGVYSHQWDADPIDPLVKVPLVVKYPHMEHGGEKFTHPVQNGDLLATLAEWFNWSVDIPDHTQPFTEPKSRTILSKSNTSIRVTTETGYAIQRRNNTKIVGEVESGVHEILDNATLPSVETMSGNVPGMDEREQEQLEERLEYLGYK